MQDDPRYADVVAEVRDFLLERTERRFRPGFPGRRSGLIRASVSARRWNTTWHFCALRPSSRQPVFRFSSVPPERPSSARSTDRTKAGDSAARSRRASQHGRVGPLWSGSTTWLRSLRRSASPIRSRQQGRFCGMLRQSTGNDPAPGCFGPHQPWCFRSRTGIGQRMVFDIDLVPIACCDPHR